ncbi:MAG: Crp/Fnr family transcriptional regulator [Bacteroidetes bacterium]|nr:Crp/Fnr family transcriptional regulator [Bacteroidota bacterium]
MKSDLLITLLEEKTSLSSAFIEALESKMQLELYKPHQIVNAAGHIENRLYFIETGFARSYFYDHHGQQHIVRFWDKGNIVFSYEGYYKIPSHYYIEIMAESRVISLSYASLYELEAGFPETSVLINAVLLQYQEEEFQRQVLISLPSEERYRFIRINYNSLFSKVPSKMIASYLHMSRETLGRYMAKR